ncbi:MAG: hypothetical protein LUP99_03435 [Methanomicrobiales archaeon]|nr:hypothetical protein [Methanomicrobiales archaeon]
MITPEKFVNQIIKNEMKTTLAEIKKYRKKFLRDIGDNQELLFSYLEFERDFLVAMCIRKAKKHFTETKLKKMDVETILEFERECLRLIPQKIQHKISLLNK